MDNEKKAVQGPEELDPEIMEQIAGGAELSAAEKERFYKIVRNMQNAGCTKEQFREKYLPIYSKYNVGADFVDQIWEIVKITSFSAEKKHSGE